MTPETYRPFFCLWRGLAYKVIDYLGAEGIRVPLCWVLDSSEGCIRNPQSITNECNSQANLASQSWLTHQWTVKNIAEGHRIVGAKMFDMFTVYGLKHRKAGYIDFSGPTMLTQPGTHRLGPELPQVRNWSQWALPGISGFESLSRRLTNQC